MFFTFAEDYIKEILSRLPSECAYIDYKQVPYTKAHYSDLIKDTIAMLNSEEGIGKNKAIVFGVENETHTLVGIDGFLKGSQEVFDDANYQNMFDKITPRPTLQVGRVLFMGKTFGYVFASKDANKEWIYEVKESLTRSGSEHLNHPVLQGQAFTRKGSKNYIMMQSDRDLLKSVCAHIMPTAFPYLSIQPTGSSLDSITVAAIIGGWRDDNDSDRQLIEALARKTYDDWLLPLQKLYENGSGIVTFKDNFWEVSNPKNVFEQYGIQLYSRDVSIIKQHIKILFEDYDPKFELAPSERFAADVYKKVSKYSPAIRFGLSNFLAIAGNYPEFFPSVPSFQLKELINYAVTMLFSSSDWRPIATMAPYFQLLAEASPNCFISSVETALQDENSALCEYLAQYESVITTTYYGDSLVRALTLIACRQDYFSSACFVAFLVIEKQPVHLTYLTSVLLPWNPKTEAPPAQRISLVRQLISKNDTLAWKLIQSLLPNQSTVSGDFIKPTYLACDFEKHFAFTVPETYYKESKKYLDLAIEMSAGQTSRLLFLIDLLDDVPEDTFYNIAIIIEHTAASLDDEGKYGLWNKLLNFVNRHWQYPNASWALSKEALSRLQQTIASIAPQNEQVQLRRLFQNNCSFIFPERTEDYRKEGSKLDSLRLKSVEMYVEKYGIDNFIQCTEQFESVYPVGKVLADSRLTTQCDPRIFQWLSSENEKHRKIGRDYAFSRFRTCEISWVEQQLSNASDIQKANLLAALPLTNEILTLVTTRLSYEAQIQYWKRLSPWYITSKDNMNLAAQKFIQYDRPYDALELVTNTLQADECALPFSTLFKLLQQIVAKQNKEQNSAHAYQIVMLIEYLQENWDDQNAVALLEWQYYNLFESYGDKGPQSLYYALGNNPESFITLLCCTFKGRMRSGRRQIQKKAKLRSTPLILYLDGIYSLG